MKKIMVSMLAVLVCTFLFTVAFAQDTEPPLGLPTIDTVTTTATATPVPVTALTTATTTATTSTQEVVDDAEVGSEIVMLVILSLVGGTGIFFVKKYFDQDRYRL